MHEQHVTPVRRLVDTALDGTRHIRGTATASDGSGIRQDDRPLRPLDARSGDTERLAEHSGADLDRIPVAEILVDMGACWPLGCDVPA